ncbi:heavy metal translocating P-type ATPase [Paenibacillus larvae]|uniref:Cd(2+)-exporting ATPase n=6 Tax=Paenibacillus larvae TaxID=1464 RepID=V9W4U1_9BACL|nr:heavy metal translocating P-type ATPase [Paenibacillus larvae]AHD06046.1 putative cadmium-transporting ATPase CadA [Paenibacillus larvae subsp. larvae DSM 25430]AQR76461.1 cadmium transporter [Paenibacillus larvae subsp. larvae]AQT83714.1 cadmium transporter [Paenibacillus larvae subsp. pulvifaciens]AQZ48863.1 heavy metal translocating P-type ATPase [Paenibacillus larvae subsp. pulvifaciens]ARF69848.1 heavy metal translocating P-type ATPase [Paenibacillus larvae subsp. pulvifaciens]
MKEYRVKGLSCGNCAQMLEQRIQELEHGENATLSYNSGKLRIDPQVSLPDVKQILKSDGAYIQAESSQVQGRDESHDHSHGEHEHTHGHDHSHEGSPSLMRNLLIVSAVIYAAAILLDGTWSAAFTIPMYLAATVISGYTTFIRGLKNLFKLVFNIDTLMTIALIGAISIGEWKEATLVAILFGLNELLEGLGMEKARRSMETLLQVAPKEALKIEGDKETVVPIATLEIGDLVLVKPGGKIPSDGTVAEGKSSVNEAAITGESLPVEKTAGEHVFGGSINNEGILKVRIDKAYEDSSLAKILHLVEKAQDTKTPTELFINKFAKYYTPLIMIIAALVIVVPPLFLGGEWSKWLYQGLAVLIVGCPCALILSSPIAIVSGITRNARNGILIKGGVFLEQLGKIDTLAFDKTGTLTKGEPHVEQTVVYEENLFYSVAGAIEKSSSHPLAKAIMKEIGSRGMELPEPEEIKTLSGSGIEAVINGRKFWLGNEKSIRHLTIPGTVQSSIEKLKAEGLTLVLVADKQAILGIFGIADEIREESKSVIEALHQSGIRQTVMLTGDHQKTAEKVARAVGVTSFYGGLLPEDKVNKIKELAQHGRVAMIGDGINDAPALASAQLGIAMGKGTDSAVETADIVLMQDHLGKLPEAVKVSKKVNRIIRFNIGVSLGLKLMALLLTIPGLLTLWIAILSDMGATIFVTLVSLTVLISRKK